MADYDPPLFGMEDINSIIPADPKKNFDVRKVSALRFHDAGPLIDKVTVRSSRALLTEVAFRNSKLSTVPLLSLDSLIFMVNKWVLLLTMVFYTPNRL